MQKVCGCIDNISCSLLQDREALSKFVCVCVCVCVCVRVLSWGFLGYNMHLFS